MFIFHFRFLAKSKNVATRTIALYYRVMKVTRHVHRKPCNLQSRFHTSAQASIRERSVCMTASVSGLMALLVLWFFSIKYIHSFIHTFIHSRHTGLNTPRIAARSPSQRLVTT